MKSYLCTTEYIEDSDTFARGLELVQENRQKKALEFTDQKSQNLSLMAGLLLRYALIQEGYDYQTLEFATSKCGKPYVVGHDEIQFSLSHDGSYVLCAIDKRPIGCDIQKDTSLSDDMLKYFCHPNEMDAFMSVSKADRHALVMRSWALKESYVKYLGNGISIPFPLIEMDLQEESASLVSEVPDMEHKTLYFFEHFSLRPKYYISICSEAPSFEDIHVLQGEALFI